MTLVLDIEHLLGVAFIARSQSSEIPDWPPQPDRVFSALVAAWGARGERAEERRALEWLEAQPDPGITSSGGFPRTAPTVFVPPNDPETGRLGDRSVMQAFRRRQARRFPAYRPDNPVVRLVWRRRGETRTIAAPMRLRRHPLCRHSSSLTSLSFRTDWVPERTKAEAPIYPGDC